MKVVWSLLAVQRIGEAAAHLAHDSPAAARRWVAAVFDAAAGPGTHPRRGRSVPEVGRPEIRELFVGSHRLVYRVDTDRSAILTVRHLRRLFDPAELGAG
jgi:plasmid stabilization system protein ParE